MNKWIYIGWGMAWIATSVAVCVAIIITKSSSPLWAMFVPTFISIARREDAYDDREEDEEDVFL